MNCCPPNKDFKTSLWRQADHPEDASDPDSVPSVASSGSVPDSEETASSSPETSSSSELSPSKEAPKPSKGALKKYIENFDKQTVVEMARLVSMEGAALVELQTQALFGDLTLLQRQMQVLMDHMWCCTFCSILVC